MTTAEATKTEKTNTTSPGADLPEGKWTADPVHSSVTFTIRHLMSKVHGSFNKFTVEADVPANPTKATFKAVIDVDSINTNEPNRDGHLKSADFFDVEKYPQMTFQGKLIEQTGESSFKVKGELTIKDVTKPVTLNGEFLGTLQDPYGNTKAGFSASTTINRDEFGLTWNAALETGGFLVGGDVKVELDIQLVLSK